jgi:hypothetical protein
MPDRPSTLRDVAAGLLVLGSLALPFLPLPGDGAARMKVDFRTGADARPQLLSTNTTLSVCTVMAAALSYEDPHTGAFTRVKCRD